MRTAIALLLLASLSFGACSCADEPKPAVEAEPPQAPAPSAPKPVLENVDPTPEQVPIPEDFEEDALKEVSEENLGAQLDALEQEITADSR